MVWTGGMPMGLFTGVRRFRLSGTDGGTRFDMSETFSGPLSGLITRMMPDLTASFERFAAALARDAEASRLQMGEPVPACTGPGAPCRRGWSCAPRSCMDLIECPFPEQGPNCACCIAGVVEGANHRSVP